MACNQPLQKHRERCQVAPTCFGLPIRPSSGGAHAVLCAVTRLDSADVRLLIDCVVCGCMSLPSVCMYVLRSCLGEVWSFHGHILPLQDLKTYIQTDGKDIRPHTTETINKRTSAESNLVTAQSKACAPPEDGGIGRPKHVGTISPKCF